MGFFSEMFSPHSLLSGGITHINDNLIDAFGIPKNGTLFALNDAAKHGPLETSIEKGRPAGFSELQKDRNQRLAQDESGNARPIADIAAAIGLMFGGAAAAGAGGAGGAAGSGTAGATGTTGVGTYGAGTAGTYGAGSAGAAGNAGLTGAEYASAFGTPAATSSSGGLLSSFSSIGQAANAASSVKGLLDSGHQQQQPTPLQSNGGQPLAQLYSSMEQSGLHQQQEDARRRQEQMEYIKRIGGYQ